MKDKQQVAHARIHQLLTKLELLHATK